METEISYKDTCNLLKELNDKIYELRKHNKDAGKRKKIKTVNKDNLDEIKALKNKDNQLGISEDSEEESQEENYENSEEECEEENYE